ncbi:hypothetical protein PFISCL1PPCAC_7235, partial [Pristionchus fissidentatus]
YVDFKVCSRRTSVFIPGRGPTNAINAVLHSSLDLNSRFTKERIPEKSPSNARSVDWRSPKTHILRNAFIREKGRINARSAVPHLGHDLN